jgi:hypothetical protein
MTTDIVDRLRWWGDQSSLYPVRADVREVAAEIERLRRQVAALNAQAITPHREAVAAERAAILDLVKDAYEYGSCRGHISLRSLMAAIKARGEK